MHKVTVDRIPPLMLGILLLAQWAGADYFAKSAGFITVSPFSQLWATYNTPDAARLVVVILAGLVFGMLIPTGRTLSVRDLLAQTQESATKLTNVWFGLALFAVALLYFVKAPYLLVAPEYLMTQGPAALASVATIMGPLGALAAGALSQRRPMVAGLCGIAIMVVLFAGATRVFSAIPLMFLVGRTVAGVVTSKVHYLAALVFAYATLPIPLISRSQASHGLLPYAAAVSQAVTQPDYLSGIGRTFGENIGMTVPLLIFVSKVHTIEADDMIASINPMPADIAGWSAIMEKMRVHSFIPYSTLGEWASFGSGVLLAFIIGWTVIVRVCISSISRNSGILRLPLLMLTIALSSLIVLEMGQYNTRAVARLVDLLILISLADLATRRIQPAIENLGKNRTRDDLDLATGS